MNDALIKHMTNRFLSWKLPANFNPDNGISAERPNYGPGVAWEPTGTNLLDYTQAEAMVRHIVEGLPDDVARLVIAAREIAYSDLDGGGNEWRAARRELDMAAEAFASRVPWDDEPNAQGIEAATADETQGGSAVGESPVVEDHAPMSPDLSTPLPSGSIER